MSWLLCTALQRSSTAQHSAPAPPRVLPPTRLDGAVQGGARKRVGVLGVERHLGGRVDGRMGRWMVVGKRTSGCLDAWTGEWVHQSALGLSRVRSLPCQVSPVCVRSLPCQFSPVSGLSRVRSLPCPAIRCWLFRAQEGGGGGVFFFLFLLLLLLLLSSSWWWWL